MADVFDSRSRSKIMRQVKSKGNASTELKLIAIFKTEGIKGWRRNYKLLGNPDFVFLRKRIAIFTDGCFWHGHNCRNTTPAQNSDYWQKKRHRNVKRDSFVNQELTVRNWVVIRFWECELRKNNLCNKVIQLKEDLAS